MKPEILLVDPMMPAIEERLDGTYTVHRLFAAPDRGALLASVAPKVRAVVAGGVSGAGRALIDALPALEIIAINGIGGAMLVIGLWTRLAGSLNAAVLLLGLLTVYVRQGVLLKGTLIDAAAGRTGAGYEYVALLAAATVLLAVGGGGGGSGGKK